MTSTIALKKTADTGTFARYVPFEDRREVIVRRGRELGASYGAEVSRCRGALMRSRRRATSRAAT